MLWLVYKQRREASRLYDDSKGANCNGGQYIAFPDLMTYSYIKKIEPQNKFCTPNRLQNKFCTPNRPQNKFCTPNRPQNKFCTPNRPQNKFCTPNRPQNKFCTPNKIWNEKNRKINLQRQSNLYFIQSGNAIVKNTAFKKT